MKKLFLFISSIAISIATYASTTVPAGDVSGTWTKTGSPYLINGNIRIPLSQTLIIEPGVVVNFQGHYGLKIRGKVIAIGSTVDSIRFTVNDTSGYYKPVTDGSWAGIIIDNADFAMNPFDSSFFHYCIFEFSKAFGANESGKGGAINFCFTDKVSINDCDFRFNLSSDLGGALYLNGKEFNINRCRFLKNQSNNGGAIGVNYGVIANLSNNVMFGNIAWSKGGAYYSFTSRSKLINNIITNNQCFANGGGLFLDFSDDYLFGNIIANNEASVGGALYLSSASPVLVNNTIVNNRAQWTGGIDFHQLCNAKIYNTIIWGNYSTGTADYSQMAFVDASTQPNFYYCDVMSGLAGIYKPTNSYIGDYKNCIDQSPDFVDATTGHGISFNALIANWNLNNTSPCLNLGTNNALESFLPEKDIYNKKRILNGVVDQGAAEAYINKKTVSGVINANTIWTADTILVNGDITINDNVTLTISPGTLVQFQGYYKIQVNGTIIANGTKQNNIHFNINDTTGFRNLSINNGGWFGIIFQNDVVGMNGQMSDNDSSLFNYCIFEYAKDNEMQFTRAPGSAIKCSFFSNLTISNSIFRNNIGLCGGAMGLTEISSPIIKNNIFYNNYSTFSGGALFVANQSSPIISGNIFSNNTVEGYEYSSGGGIYLSKSNAIVVNNIICNNHSGVNGGGINISFSNPLFANNTVVNNTARVGAGVITGWCIPILYNSIIKGNVSSDNEGDDIMAITESPKIENCNFSKSKTSNVNPQNIINPIDTLPDFIKPSMGAGPIYNGLIADWHLSDFSNLINKGKNISTTYGQYYNFDFDGNARFNYGAADIGAYENQSSPIAIETQPYNNKRCIGDTIIFNVRSNTKCKYQWVKNNKPIVGEINDTLIIKNASLQDDANYSCILSNGYGSVESNIVSASINQAPEFLSFSDNVWAREMLPLKIETTFSGSNPVSFKWYKNNTSLLGSNKPVYNKETISATDEGYYQCEISNICGTVKTDSIKVFLAPQICMVTIDSATGKNLIVWDKNTTLPVAQYNVYREGIAKGIYEKIGQVKPEKYTLFRDLTANPQKQAYWYKITTVDSSGTESDIDACIPHKTIHLLVTRGYQGGVQLDWDGYYGFPFGTYAIMKSTDGGKTFEKSDDLASSNQTWSDVTASQEGYKYCVSVVKTNPCNATLLKAESGPYAQSLSNIAEFKTTGIEQNDIAISVFPNPATDEVTIYTEGKGTLTLTDVSGRIIKQISITTNATNVDLTGVAKGLYLISVQTSDSNGVRKLVVE